MSSLVKTKTRLNSTKSTQKVIKAMELVASSKIKVAKEKAINNKFYFESTIRAMQTVLKDEKMGTLLDLSSNEEETLLIGITSDMGLCGAYNTNVLKEVLKINKEQENIINLMVGSKGIAKLNYEKIDMYDNISDLNRLSDYELAKQISDIMINLLSNKKINKIIFVATEYINPIMQQVKVLDVLDLKETKELEVEDSELLIIGDKKEIFEHLLLQYIRSLTYSEVLNSAASEHASRRNSMEAANTNSLELIDKLNLEMNRIRQSMITQEISEIIGGSEALK